jgi:TetR/AcrR family transcriptional repressor of lmrAB and yxaGH operons
MSNAAQHREAIVRTTMRLFRKQGYASTGLQQILAESGAPKGSLYHYFPGGKEALGEAAVTLAGNLIAEMLSELAGKHRKASHFVRGYCEVMAGWMQESGFRSGCPIATTMLETAPHSPALTQAGNRAIAQWTDIICKVFEGAGEEPRMARARARALIAQMEGALLLSRIEQSIQPIMEIASLYE